MVMGVQQVNPWRFDNQLGYQGFDQFANGGKAGNGHGSSP